MRRAALAALLCGMLAVAATPRDALAQVSVDQAELVVDPTAVGAQVTSFTVTNEGPSVAEVTVYLGDWERGEDGEHHFLPSGTLPRSCARYLDVFPQGLRLPPGAHQAVRIAVADAAALSATCWSIVFVEQRSAAAPAPRQITYVTRLGVKLYLIPPGLPKQGEVVDFAVASRPARPPTSGRALLITFRNTGGVPVWVHGAVEYRRPDNSIAGTDSVAEFPVLPDARRVVTRALPAALPAGRYVALALLDYGGSELAAGQLAVDVP